MSRRSTLVLVHGSFHGPWCWDRVVPYFESAGFSVSCPALPEISSPTIQRSDHVTALAETLTDEPIILVGHSYAGMLLAEAARAAAEEIVQCIYFDAFVPEVGESAFELLGDFGQLLRDQSADSGLIPPPPAEALGISEKTLAQEVSGKLVPMAATTHDDTAKISALAQHSWQCAYLRCRQFDGFAAQANRAKNAGWNVSEIDAGHDAMISHPTVFTESVLEIIENADSDS